MRKFDLLFRDKILKEKEIEHLNTTLINLKTELRDTKDKSGSELTSLRNSFSQEKNIMNKKLEEANLQISQSNIKIMSQEQKNESDNKNFKRLVREFEKQLEDKTSDYSNLRAQYDSIVKEYKEESDQWLETQSENTKNLALQKQKVNHQF